MTTRLAYIEGEEEKALWYFRQRYEQEIDPEVRAKLSRVIKELEDILKNRSSTKIKKFPKHGPMTSIALSSNSF